MNEFIKVLLSLSLSGTLLFLLVFLPKPLYRERFSRKAVVAPAFFIHKGSGDIALMEKGQC